MKLNLASPSNGTVKQFEIHDDILRRVNLVDYRLGNDVDGSIFGDEYKGYTFRLQGGSDKEGFPMVHGVMASARVALLLKRGTVGFQSFRGKAGERRKKSIRGCILNADVAVINAVIVANGEKPIEGLTDVSVPRRLGPKRASNIRKVMNLTAQDDVRKFLVRRKVSKAGKKDRFKAARVQRVVDSNVKARHAAKAKANLTRLQKSAEERREYLSLISGQRMASRQRKNATLHRQKVAQEAAYTKAGAPKSAAAKKTVKK
eukprot:GILJ01006413.1.p2 GENE.GILJ01006413.1~~GILJ01006413.1.p2  ORF type:complete len:269 (+),score=77.12 GILJ01006413.1:28-807(+)